jgi:hypothetical protein
LASHDLEDIITLIDGREELVNEVKSSSVNLKRYLSETFTVLVNNPLFLSALPGHLNYSPSIAQERMSIVLERMQAIVKF